MVWVLVGIKGCVLRPTRHSLVTLFSLSVSVKDRSLHWVLSQSQIYYPEHILVYGRMEGLLLSYRGFRLFSGSTDWRRGWWRSKHRTEFETQERGLRVQVWTGTWTTWQESGGLVLLVPGVQAERVFRDTQLVTLIHESPTIGLSTVLHRSKNWKIKGDEIKLFAHLLLESRIGAYIEWLDNEIIMTAKNKHT